MQLFVLQLFIFKLVYSIIVAPTNVKLVVWTSWTHLQWHSGRKPWGQQGYAHILLRVSRDLLLSNSSLLAEFKHGFVDIVASYRHVNVIGDFYFDLLRPINLEKSHWIKYITMFHYYNLSILLISTVPVGTWLTVMPVADPGHVVQHA